MFVSVVITTKNRKLDLLKAVNSVISQLYSQFDILIFEDGGDDEAIDFIKSKVTDDRIKYHYEPRSIGLINARNKAARLVKGEIIFSIDDDAIFSSNNIISTVVNAFGLNKRIAAIAIPHKDVLYNNRTFNYIDELKQNEFRIVSNFIGTSHAIKRNIFLKLNCYPSNFLRQEEEIYFSLELLKNNYFVAAIKCDFILHYESPIRNLKTILYYWSRNYFLTSYRFYPMKYFIINFILLLPKLVLSQYKKNVTKHGFYFFTIVGGIINGVINLNTIRRNPISNRQYKLFKKLRKKPLKLEIVQSFLKDE